MATQHTEIATFGAGCFWGVQASFDALDGVLDTIAGYTGGNTENPTYEQICRDDTGHAEVIQIEFDPTIINYETLLSHFFDMHDPTTLNRQGPDVGTQYRSVIFYHDVEQETTANKMIEKFTQDKCFKHAIVTEVTPATPFYAAEDYHQKYLAKRGLSSCQIKQD